MIFFNTKRTRFSFELSQQGIARLTLRHTVSQRFFRGCGRVLRSALAQTSDFALASFVFVLSYRHHATSFETTAQLSSRTKVFNPGFGMQPTYSLRFLWYAWSNLISTLFALSERRCSFLMLVSSKLRLIAQAMS